MYARVNGEWVAGQDLLLARSGDNGRSVVVVLRQENEKPDKNRKRYQINSSNRLSLPHLEEEPQQPKTSATAATN